MCSIEEETWSRSSQSGGSIEIGAAHLGENTHYFCNFCNFCDAMWYIMCSIEVGASAIITVRRCNWNWSGALRWGNVLEHQRKCHKLSQHLNLTANGDDNDDDDVTRIIDQTNRMSNGYCPCKTIMTKCYGERDRTWKPLSLRVTESICHVFMFSNHCCE